MIPSGENGSTWRKTSATLSTNRRRIDLNSNTRATKPLGHSTAANLCRFFEGRGIVCGGVPNFYSFDA